MQKLETLVARFRVTQDRITYLTYAADNTNHYSWEMQDALNLMNQQVELEAEKKNLKILKDQIIKCLDEEIKA